MTEHQLIRRTLTGDADAERQLYNAHVDRVYRLAFRMTGDGPLAEDLTQDTFIRAFDRLADFRGDGAFAGWLHRIATSVIYTALRKRQQLQRHETSGVEPEYLESVARAKTVDRDLRLRLDAAIGTLDLNHRLVFVMHDLEGFTHPEIAAAMDTPVGTAKARLSRARKKLRAQLSDYRVNYQNNSRDLEMES